MIWRGLTDDLNVESAAGLVTGWVRCCVGDGHFSNWEEVRWGKGRMDVD